MNVLSLNIFKLIFISNLLLGCPILYADAINITLKKNVYMSSGRVLLKNLADIDMVDIDIHKKISNIGIIKSPRVGYVEILTRKNIEKILKRNPLVIENELKFDGAEKVFIRSNGEKHLYSDFIKMATDKLLAEFKSGKREIKFKLDSKIKYINLPYGQLKYETRINSTSISPRMCVWIDVFLGDYFYRSIPVWVNVSIFEPVYLAKINIERNSVISESDFFVSKKNIALLYGNNLKVDEFNNELLVKETIEAGGTLRIDNVKSVPAVIAGKVIDAMVNEGAVSIQVKATARNDAEVGEIVKVKSLQGGRILKTIVVGKQLVKVI